MQWSFFFQLLAKQKIADERIFEGRNRQHGAAASADPIHNDVLEISVPWASPLEAGAQDGIEISARVIEGFEIENGNEYHHQPSDVVVPEANQTFKFFTSYDERRSNETVEDGRELWVLLAESFRSQPAEKRGDAFNESTSQRGYLKREI